LGQKVWRHLRTGLTKLKPRWAGPFEIKEIVEAGRVYKIRKCGTNRGRMITVNIEDLKQDNSDSKPGNFFVSISVVVIDLSTGDDFGPIPKQKPLPPSGTELTVFHSE